MSEAREKAVERLAKAIHWTQDGVLPRAEHVAGFVEAADDAAQITAEDMKSADALMREIGLVAIEPALVEAVARAQAWTNERHTAEAVQRSHIALRREKLAIADAILAQLGAKP